MSELPVKTPISCPMAKRLDAILMTANMVIVSAHVIEEHLLVTVQFLDKRWEELYYKVEHRDDTYLLQKNQAVKDGWFLLIPTNEKDCIMVANDWDAYHEARMEDLAAHYEPRTESY
jgi:hypothetical protein